MSARAPVVSRTARLRKRAATDSFVGRAATLHGQGPREGLGLPRLRQNVGKRADEGDGSHFGSAGHEGDSAASIVLKRH
jgi:hypothetical protein